ncbi:hypothetical protein HOO65_110062 [Ceratocystis lukuohia]|uniref:Uncharacterized protein n=1 Tax=Ceratocystis lukuohia TaxID=2019550 RepID=A0ABR4M8J4_9PEZI
MRVSTLFSISLPILCLRNCKPKAVEDVQPYERLVPGPTKIADVQPFETKELGFEATKIARAGSFDANEPVSTDASGPEPSVSHSFGYITNPPKIICNDITNRSYLYDRGYYTSDFFGDTNNINIYSDHFGEYRRDTVVSFFFNREKKVASVRDDNLHLETPHKYKLSLSTIYEGVRYLLGVGQTRVDWLVMDINDGKTLKIVKKYQRQHKLEPEAEIRLTPESPDWDFFTDTYHYEQAAEMLPGRIKKIIIKRKERVIEGTNFPTAAVHVIMFSHSYAAKEAGASPADSVKLEQDRLDSAIKAVDKIEAAELRIALELSPGVRKFIDLLKAAARKSFLESLWGPTPYDVPEVVPDTVPETASDGIDWESIWKLSSDPAPNSESETTSEAVPETVPDAESEDTSDDLDWEAMLELSLESASKTEP